MTKVLPPIEFPSKQDMDTASQMVAPSHPSGIYTDDERKEVNRIARTLMMKRKTIQ